MKDPAASMSIDARLYAARALERKVGYVKNRLDRLPSAGLRLRHLQ
jgi:hypothetical protein